MGTQSNHALHASMGEVSSLGVLTSFGKYDSFEVLENIQAPAPFFYTKRQKAALKGTGAPLCLGSRPRSPAS